MGVADGTADSMSFASAIACISSITLASVRTLCRHARQST